MKYTLLAAALMLAAPSLFALETACEPLINASKARMAQAAWHSLAEGDGIKLEAIKVDGKFYINHGKKWQKSPMDLDKAEQIAIDSILDGSLKITNCKEEGTETIAGVETTILGYDSEVEGTDLGKGRVKIYLGKKDGLPYQTTFDNSKATYRYTQVTAPRL
ncbi:hypothetical protein [Thiofilum flexile]|uniref:hypothetical protein n=1 Tax=Thiofilum flexile TaxID=125627 RepID=UPI00037AF0D5|nr:hypothetical protein [Thiofilum flexile]